MGVPAFFRWLSRKYASIVVNAHEERPKPTEDGSEPPPVDATKPNPNNVEFDNLYLDMNGIIHPCCHPESKPTPANEDEMMVAMFEYIDRLMSIVRPRRLLYMAIDGVAPRAKMNQQRSRRFRASQESQQRRDDIAKVRERLRAEGIPVPEEKPADEHFDSNCITPGTPFMDRLAVCLRYYIYSRLDSHPAWQNIQVILSDANVPGEGEHKIMDYIRRQRGSPSHDPNTHHCLCGADADLIMLGLATHEPQFTIIREEFVPNKQSPCALCKKYGHELDDCQGLLDNDTDTASEEQFRETNFIFIKLAVLREYLSRELHMDALPFEFDLERAIDDWVFMCFFVGNDFLPHLPSLEIRENAIDRLIKLYKECVYRTNGWLTESGSVHMARVQLILTKLGEVEDEIFVSRQRKDKFFKQKRKRERRQKRAQSADGRGGGDGYGGGRGGVFAPTPVGRGMNKAYSGMDIRHAARDMRRNAMNTSGGGDTSDSEPDAPDEVRLYDTGWKERYYQAKFEVSSEDKGFRHGVARAYAIGLCWVLKYYYQGVPSWKWFYPFHYAPFASDFVGIGDMKIHLEQDTEPFKPMEQLMGVFPAASRQHIPPPWHPLMTDIDSAILDFYPADFKVDLNGKKFAWQGVALLPFVEEHRLLKALEPLYPLLSDEERRRNTLGTDRLFVSRQHKCFQFVQAVYAADGEQADGGGDRAAAVHWLPVESELCYGMAGDVGKDELAVLCGNACPCPMKGRLPDVPNCQAVGVKYRDGRFPAGHVFASSRLDGAKEPEATLKPGDWNERRQGRYEPVVGFSRNRQHSSLDRAGHRMVQRAAGVYAQVPPPEPGSWRDKGPRDGGRGWGGDRQPYGSDFRRPQPPQHRRSYGDAPSTADSRNMGQGQRYQPYPQPYGQWGNQQAPYGQQQHQQQQGYDGRQAHGYAMQQQHQYGGGQPQYGHQQQHYATGGYGGMAQQDGRQQQQQQQYGQPRYGQQQQQYGDGARRDNQGNGGRPSAADYF